MYAQSRPYGVLAGMQHVSEGTGVKVTVLRFGRQDPELLAFGSQDGTVYVLHLGKPGDAGHVSSQAIHSMRLSCLVFDNMLGAATEPPWQHVLHSCSHYAVCIRVCTGRLVAAVRVHILQHDEQTMHRNMLLLLLLARTVGCWPLPCGFNLVLTSCAVYSKC